MVTKLTKRVVEALPVPAKGYTLTRDTELRGFAVRVLASGTRTFVFERKIHGRTRRWTLGRLGELTVAEARDKGRALAGKLAHGIDPDTERKRGEVEARTFADALADYLRVRPLKPKTRQDCTATLHRYLSDWMGRKVSEITTEDVVDRYGALCKRTVSGANSCMRYARAVFGFALEAWRLPDGSPALRENPVRTLSALRAWRKVPRRRETIGPHVLPDWWAAVEADPDPRARDFFQFVLLTGCRRSEALNLTWDRVDLKGGTVLFTETKNAEDLSLPVGPYLLGMLERRRDGAGPERVFSGADGVALDNMRYPMDRIRGASGVPFRTHDLRRTFLTVAESMDMSAYVLKKLVNHALPDDDVTAGYLRLTPERLRAAMTKIEARILALAGVPMPGKVIRLHGEAAR